jgi:hypothetical protein
MAPNHQARESIGMLSEAAGWFICNAGLINEYTAPDFPKDGLAGYT